MKTEIEKRDDILMLKDEKKVYLENCKVSLKNRIMNVKYASELTDEDQISIISDAMFKTMLCNSERKMYVCKLLSELLNVPYDYLMENSEYYKNEFDRDHVDAKSERGDLVLKINDDYVTVEMNMRDETKRNVEYADRLYRSKIRVGSEYIYPSVLSINFNNYYYEEYEEDTMQVFHMQTDKGVCLVKKSYVQIYLPLLFKKWYTKGERSMSAFEKMAILMTSTKRREALELAKGDEIMKRYVEEAKKVEKSDDDLREAYDHELSAKQAEREAGYSEGRYIGFEEGRTSGFEEGRTSGFEEGRTSGFEEGQKDIIKSLYTNGLDIQRIHKLTKIDLKTIEDIISDTTK